MLIRLIPLIVAFRSLRRLRRDRNGSAAVEFALVAPMFFALLFAIIETGFMFFAGQVLENAAIDSGRLIFTSQVQAKNMSKAEFQQQICSRTSGLFSCNGIYPDVRSFAPGSVITLPDPIDSSGAFKEDFVFNPSGSPNTVVVRVFYQWPLFVTRLGYNMANINRGTSEGKRLLAATVAFRPQ